MNAPSKISVPSQFQSRFKDLKDVYVWRLVDKVTTDDTKEEKVFVVSDKHLFLFNTEGVMSRLARLSDIELAARNHSENSETICIKFFKELAEPSLMLVLKSDTRNQGKSQDPLVVINYFRKLARNGEELEVRMLSDNKKPDEFRPWTKPPSYHPPIDKLNKKREYLFKGSVRPPQAPRAPNTYQPGDYVQLARLTGEHEEFNGMAGIVSEYDDKAEKYKVAFPYPVNMQAMDTRNLDKHHYAVDPNSVAKEFLVQPGELGLAFSEDLVITEVEPGKPGAAAGIPLGRKIVAINHKYVKTIPVVTEAHQQAKHLPYIVTVSGEADFEDEEYGEGDGEGHIQQLEEQLYATRLSLEDVHKKLRETQEERDRAMETARQTQMMSPPHVSRAPPPPRQKTVVRRQQPLEEHLGSLLLDHISSRRRRPSYSSSPPPSSSHHSHRTRLGPYRTPAGSGRTNPVRSTDPLVSAIIHSTRHGGDPHLFTTPRRIRSRAGDLDSLSAIL
eukprot:TRINITY_DN1789_c3_g1_i1.p1 TRINITY_DN1789_c3_g1~~TRINITY_DN1789_c3_g1_i1.p1  ORF type:complete len:534 (+),score=83.59 TRINITY_DN1789_c3_g1_i1:101-1603(+)